MDLGAAPATTSPPAPASPAAPLGARGDSRGADGRVFEGGKVGGGEAMGAAAAAAKQERREEFWAKRARRKAREAARPPPERVEVEVNGWVYGWEKRQHPLPDSDEEAEVDPPRPEQPQLDLPGSIARLLVLARQGSIDVEGRLGMGEDQIYRAYDLELTLDCVSQLGRFTDDETADAVGIMLGRYTQTSNPVKTATSTPPGAFLYSLVELLEWSIDAYQAFFADKLLEDAEANPDDNKSKRTFPSERSHHAAVEDLWWNRLRIRPICQVILQLIRRLVYAHLDDWIQDETAAGRGFEARVARVFRPVGNNDSVVSLSLLLLDELAGPAKLLFSKPGWRSLALEVLARCAEVEPVRSEMLKVYTEPQGTPVDMLVDGPLAFSLSAAAKDGGEQEAKKARKIDRGDKEKSKPSPGTDNINAGVDTCCALKSLFLLVKSHHEAKLVGVDSKSKCVPTLVRLIEAAAIPVTADDLMTPAERAQALQDAAAGLQRRAPSRQVVARRQQQRGQMELDRRRQAALAMGTLAALAHKCLQVVDRLLEENAALRVVQALLRFADESEAVMDHGLNFLLCLITNGGPKAALLILPHIARLDFLTAVATGLRMRPRNVRLVQLGVKFFTGLACIAVANPRPAELLSDSEGDASGPSSDESSVSEADSESEDDERHHRHHHHTHKENKKMKKKKKPMKPNVILYRCFKVLKLQAWCLDSVRRLDPQAKARVESASAPASGSGGVPLVVGGDHGQSFDAVGNPIVLESPEPNTLSEAEKQEKTKAEALEEQWKPVRNGANLVRSWCSLMRRRGKGGPIAVDDVLHVMKVEAETEPAAQGAGTGSEKSKSN